MKNATGWLFAGVLLMTVVPQRTEARVVRLVVEDTRPFADGKPFADAGPFVRLQGTVYMEVDPKDPLERRRWI